MRLKKIFILIILTILLCSTYVFAAELQITIEGEEQAKPNGTIGENSKIGAGSVVLEEVPPNCTVVGVPGRVVRMGNQKVPRSEMDHIHLPDPVLNDIRTLQHENEQLRGKLWDMEKRMEACGLGRIRKNEPDENRQQKKQPAPTADDGMIKENKTMGRKA